MDPTEIHETAAELRETGHEHQGVAIFISLLAVLLAFTSMGGSNATKEMMNANIVASDTYAFYQAKTTRQTNTRLAADQLAAFKASSLWLSDSAARQFDERLKTYQTTIDKYESEPKIGEGKAELLAKARRYEAIRDHAAKQDPYFDYSEALLQIAIVLASASIVARRRWVLHLSYGIAIIGTTLMINAFTLWVDYPL